MVLLTEEEIGDHLTISKACVIMQNHRRDR